MAAVVNALSHNEHMFLHNAQTLQSNQLHWWYLSIF